MRSPRIDRASTLFEHKYFLSRGERKELYFFKTPDAFGHRSEKSFSKSIFSPFRWTVPRNADAAAIYINELTFIGVPA